MTNSNPKLTSLNNKLESIALGKWNSDSSGLRDVLRDAVRHGIIEKDALATALGCETPHLNSAIVSYKQSKVVSGLKTLGFGE